MRRKIESWQSEIDYVAHYLSALARKPNAFRQVASVLMEQLREQFPSLWRELVEKEGTANAARKMARLCEAINELGRDETVRRIQARQSKGECVTLQLLGKPQTKSKSLSNVPANLRVEVQSSSCTKFNALMEPEASRGAA